VTDSGWLVELLDRGPVWLGLAAVVFAVIVVLMARAERRYEERVERARVRWEGEREARRRRAAGL